MDKPSFTVEFGYLTDKGSQRNNNEDSVLVSQKLGLAAVADGMGGHNAGELASSLAVKTLCETLASINGGRLSVDKRAPGLSAAANKLRFAMFRANSVIYETSRREAKSKGMGTTLSAILIEDGSAALAHVGDSRIYLLREGALAQLTTDHSLVMEQLSKGLITKEEAETSTMQNILTRAIGIHRSMEPDAADVAVRGGDKLLLCSDGLFKAVKEEDIKRILSRRRSPGRLCRELVSKAIANGGPDNVTVAVAEMKTPGFFSVLLRKFFSADDAGPAFKAGKPAV